MAIAIPASGAAPTAVAGTGPDSASRSGGLAVLSPVDVATNRTRPEWAAILRDGFRRTGHWKVLGADSLGRRFREYNLDTAKPCREFQCAFDAGNVLQVEYVMFGTVTELPGFYAYSLDLVHVPGSQVVWSEAGEVLRKGGRDSAGPLQARLAALAGGLAPASLDLRKRDRLGLMAILAQGDASPAARVLADRMSTNVYASRQYDLMSQAELDDLLAALGQPKLPDPPAPGDLQALGEKLGVQYLVCSRLRREGPRYRLQLTGYDVKDKRMLRQWPSNSTPDLRKLLRLEQKFFSTLDQPADMPALAGPHKDWFAPPENRVRVAGAGASVAAGVGAGIVAFLYNRAADREYARFQASRSEATALAHKRRVEARDRSTWIWGGLGAVCTGLGIVLWTF